MKSSLRRLLAFDRGIRGEFKIEGRIAGVDEAGRGPLAGPVVAAAVIFLRETLLPGLNDSKLVPEKRRESLFFQISACSATGIGIATEEEIDKINIYQASRLAMKRAVLALTHTPDYLLIDGKAGVDLPVSQKSVVDGDAKSACIAAASIIAKTYRDAWMGYLDGLYPEYQFKKHKGYATRCHLEIIRAVGPSPVHRKSFAPIHSFRKETV